jgi:hypothetical protein
MINKSLASLGLHLFLFSIWGHLLTRNSRYCCRQAGERHRYQPLK